jgi:aldose 1-epimerase
MKILSRFFFVAIAITLLVALAGPSVVSATGRGRIDVQPYGVTADGIAVEEYTLTNSRGMEVKIITYGGIITSVKLPVHRGKSVNVVLGFDNLQDYEAQTTYFGCITGRYANRIAGGKFTLNGIEYQLDLNNGPNHLHGGFKGFDKQVWEVTKEINEPKAVGIELHYLSPDGDQKYPGALDTFVTYRLTDRNEIRIDYKATNLDPTLSTIVNLTNHSYWNLMGEGEGDVLDHILKINADRYTPVDETLIPTGEIAPVAGTLFDFRKPKPVSKGIRSDDPQVVIGRGWDHNWVLRRPSFEDTRLILAASLKEPKSGRTLEIWTTEPGIQFYSGNFLDGTVYGTSHRAYRQGDGLALETQHFPDSPNHDNFPSTVLGPGEIYETTTIFKLKVQRPCLSGSCSD